MKKLVALKRLRYPRGVGGKEYTPGDEFTPLSERDAKAFLLVRAAKESDGKKRPLRVAEPKPVKPVAEATPAATTEPAVSRDLLAEAESGDAGPKRAARSTYLRSDMQAEDN